MACKPTKASKELKSQGVQVFVRCRPPSHNEIQQKSTSVVDVRGAKEVCVQDRSNPKVAKTFTFDGVFGPSTTQVEVYRAVVEPLISDVLAGYNCAVFAYGQTGSGKTHTMEGQLHEDPNKLFDPDSRAGIIPRTMCALFDELRLSQAEYTVRISLLELYNEELYDLLSPDPVPPKLRMFDDSTKKGSVIVQGLQEVMVHTRAQTFAELRKGSAKRQVASTLINSQSSRSHTVFCVTVHLKENSVKGEELLKMGKLYLVDLAGSENIGRSGSVDKRAREAGSINQSLLTLGRVISGLVERQPHIPYRESKLTRLLQDSLGGRTKMSFIATISPALTNVEESLSTLDYAHKAKSLTNKPEINQKVSKKVIMKEYMNVIEVLKSQLELHRKGSGIYVADENYKEMQNEWSERSQELNEIVAEMKAISQKMESTEEIFRSLSCTLEEKEISVKEVDEMLKVMRIRVREAEELLEATKVDNKEADELVREVAQQEEEIRKRAAVLLSVVEEYNEDCNRIHERLDMSRSALKSNENVILKLQEDIQHLENKISMKFAELQKALNYLMILNSLCAGQLSHANKEVQLFQQCLFSTLNLCQYSLKKYVGILREKINALSDWNVKTLSELKKSSDKSLSEMQALDNIISEVVKNTSMMVSRIPDEMISIVAHSEEKFSAFQKLIINEKNILCAQFEKSDTTLCNKRQKIEETTDILHSDMQQERKRQLEFSKVSVGSINNIKAALSELSFSNSQHSIQTSASFEGIDQKMSVLDDMVNDYNSTFEDELKKSLHLSEKSRANINQLGTSLLNDVSGKIGRIIPIHENAMHSLEGLFPAVSNLETSQKATMLELKTTSEASLLQRQEIYENYIKEEALINELKPSLLKSSEHLVGKKIDFEKGMLTFIEEPNNSLNLFSAQARAIQSDVSNLVLGQTTLLENKIKPSICEDCPTGNTPARRPASVLPRETHLPSPIERKVKSRVQNALDKLKKMKPIKKTLNLHDEDEQISSDSEVTNRNQAPLSTGLAKSHSLVDLRSAGNFCQPKAPASKKKFVRSRKQCT